MLDLTRPPPDRPASAARRAKNERGNAVTPTSTAAQSRVALYQPSQRPTLRTGEWMTTSYGRCRVKGKLGQRHADVIDTIMYHAEKRRMASGGLELLVDPARVRRMLSDSGYSHDPDGHPKLLHLWPVKLLQAGRGDCRSFLFF